MAWLNGELLTLYNFYYKLLLSGMVHLLGGSVYLMYLDMFGMYCEYGFEGLMCEKK